MKIVYQGSKWKDHSRHRSLDELKKRKRARCRKKTGIINKKILPLYPKITVNRKENKAIAHAPSKYCIVGNIEEMLSFFRTIREYAKQGLDIFFDMSQIDQMTEDAILYTLSCLHEIQHRFHQCSVSGNLPRDKPCSKLLIESGFFNHVQPRFKYNFESNNILRVEDGEESHGRVAQGVILFASKKLGRTLASVERKKIYDIIIEAMTNTKQHAYSTVLRETSKWWIIAQYSSAQKMVHFTFLDTGKGIPATIKKKRLERVGGFLSKGTRDSEYIHSTLKGEFRSSTGESYRGLGLPEVYKHAKAGYIKNLVIVANNGYVNCEDDQLIELKERFRGTLISWDFV